MASNRVVTGIISNNSSATLTLGTNVLEWGHWNTNPPQSIPPNSSGTFIAQGAGGSATGTQGQVNYLANGATLSFNFNDPYEPGDAFSSSSSSGSFAVSNNSPSGNQVTVTYQVNNG